MATTKTKARPAPKQAEPITLPPGTESALSRKQIAAALGIGLRSLDAMVATGDYPESDLRFGSSVRWSQEVHNAWVRAKKSKGRG